MQIAVLSTYFENVGDDLIRSGILEALPSEHELVHVSKSNKLSLIADLGRLTHFPRWQMNANSRKWHDRLLRFLSGKLYSRLANRRTFNADLLLVAGTPLFYFTKNRFTFLKQGFWAKDLIERFIDLNKPIIIVGAGVIFDKEPNEQLNDYPEERAFFERLLSHASFFSIRDPYSLSMFDSFNTQPSLSYCPSLWNSPLQVKRDQNKVYISYSTESASIDLDESNSRSKRFATLKAIVDHLKSENYEVFLVSHNQVDLATQKAVVKELGLPAPIDLEKNKMLEVLGTPRCLISWRVHGAMAARIMNTPVLLFKTDNRYKMAEEVGAEIADDRSPDLDPIATIKDFLKTEAKVGVDQIRRASEMDRLKQELLRLGN